MRFFKNKKKIRHLFKNLENDVYSELVELLEEGSDLSYHGVRIKAEYILYMLSPYGKELWYYRFKFWR